ncbi:MAG TPA: bifunctional YncE family protein/alkaline phosphatase family protein [Candidatus Elarobacter sp.]|nr:bifunctional YncE family protein/alkaline phosphatase family protein [Candidatus Elarobacter sp.]
MKPHLLALALVSLLPVAVAAAPPHKAAPHKAAPHHAARRIAPPRADVVEYAAPAGTMPAEHLRGGVYDAVLPSGRIVTPVGQSVVTGMNALGVALSPDGRFAIVTNDDEREAQVPSLIESGSTGGFTLAVVDTSTMQVVDHYRSLDDTFWVGVAALADPAQPGRTLVLASGGPSNAVYVFDLDPDGHLRPDVKHVIALPSSTDTAFADAGHAFPGTIAVSTDGRRAYVVDEGDDMVTTIDVATRLPAGTPHAVGFFPFGAALAGDRLLVTDEGLMRYATLSPVTAWPPFRTPPADVQRASALSFLKLTADGDVSALTQDAPPFANAPLAMDPPPDGLRSVGGAHPTAIAVTRDGAYAFVAMTNVDRIATVALGGTPRVVGGTELRLFDKGPYGTQPAALALSKDGARLYVALAGLDAVAVIDAHDPIHLHRLGLIATGWYPTALALSADDRTLYVVNTKGFGHDADFTGDPVIAADASAVWSTLQKIDLAGVQLKSTTMMTLANTRRVVAAPPRYPRGITHVVVIEEEGRTFDAMLGDFGADFDGDPRFVAYGESVTPNLHALARRYGLAVNLFADAEEADAGHQFVAGGLATLYSERTLFDKTGRGTLIGQNQDPEDYPRSGYIFNALARHRIAYRDYGDLVQLSGFGGDADDPRNDDPQFAGPDDRGAATQSLGGWYSLDVPAPAALDGHIDLNYPGWNLRIRDERRAREFIRDYGSYVAHGQQPRYVAIWLPDGRAGSGTAIPPAAEEVADSDRALGMIVQYLSHLPSWRHTALFIVPDDAHGSRDHVDEYRTYAIVAGPFAKRHYLGRRHLSTVSVLKTTEQLLGVGNLSIGDLLATDMADFFTPSGGDAAPYEAIPVPQQGG